MARASQSRSMIVRTERGLSIEGTRITLYDVMDYVKGQYPSQFIQGLFELTDLQINAALAYIEANSAEVEAEYQQILKVATELRDYYQEQNHELAARIAINPSISKTHAAWTKLQALRAKRESKA